MEAWKCRAKLAVLGVLDEGFHRALNCSEDVPRALLLGCGSAFALLEESEAEHQHEEVAVLDLDLAKGLAALLLPILALRRAEKSAMTPALRMYARMLRLSVGCAILKSKCRDAS